MKLRILDDSLRLRLNRSEVRQLISEGTVERRSHFANGEFVYSLRAVDQVEPLTAKKSDIGIFVHIDRRDALGWARSDRASIEFTQMHGDRSLHILIEKDFPCRHCDDGELPEKFTSKTMEVDVPLVK